uniref:Putative secreted protein n=1 Tax=Anopheles marajoara TaxID=58244 RepID=A0A2M4CED7_9DIPT
MARRCRLLWGRPWSVFMAPASWSDLMWSAPYAAGCGTTRRYQRHLHQRAAAAAVRQNRKLFSQPDPATR